MAYHYLPSMVSYGVHPTQYEVVRKLGRQDAIVQINSSAGSRKYWPGLPEQIEVRLVSRKINGKLRQVLTSMTDPLRYPVAEIADLYAHRW